MIKYSLVYRHECFTGKYTTHKIHMKLHPGPGRYRWHHFPLFYDCLCLSGCLSITKRTLHISLKIWILCSCGKNSLVRCAHLWDIIHLLYRYWWNTRIFPFNKKSYLHRAQWRYYFYLSCVRMLVFPWLLIWVPNYKRAFCLVARPVLLKFHSQNGFEVRRLYN